MSNNLNLGGNKVVSVGTPTDPNDATNKAYVDAIEVALQADIDTNAEIAAKIESYFSGNQLDVGGINADSADFDSASITTLTSVNGVINNATLGQVTIDSASISAGVATLASAQITNATLTAATVTNATVTTLNMESVALDNIKPFQIYNSAGAVVLAGYLLSTSNNAGTL
jgi:uncharacterized protein YjbI with pentapeptide repeats